MSNECPRNMSHRQSVEACLADPWFIDSSHSHSETSCQLRRQKDAMIGRHRDSECEFPCTYSMHTHISQVKPTLGGFPKDPGFGAITSSGGFIDMDTNHQSVCRLR